MTRNLRTYGTSAGRSNRAPHMALLVSLLGGNESICRKKWPCGLVFNSMAKI